jgi:transcriptional regulator with AAA-type ATPase domain
VVHEAFEFVRFNQVHGSALLGISRNVMRTLLKRHGLLSDAPTKHIDEALYQGMHHASVTLPLKTAEIL